MKISVVLCMMTLILTSCGASVKSGIMTPKPALTINDKVAFLDLHHELPDKVERIGDAKFGDTGFSTDCDFNSNLIKAREIARKNGANIVKVIEKKTPDIWSTCYRIKVEFFFYEGNVENLMQYKLQLN